MKNQSGTDKRLLMICGMVPLIAGVVSAAEIENYGTNGVLSEGASWVGGIAPGTGDTALWNGAGAAASGGWSHVLGASASWYGLRTTNCIEDLSIVDEGSESLTLGAGGITVYGKNTYLSVPLTLSADQTWTLSGGVDGSTALYANAPVSGDRALTANGQYLVFQQPVSLARLTVDNAVCILRNEATLRCPVSVNSGRTFCWHRTSGNWSDVVNASLTNQNGILRFGWFSYVAEAALHSGDLIAGQISSDRAAGRIHIEEARLLNDGGTISNNWFYLRTGRFEQSSGTTWLKNGIYAGFDNNAYTLEKSSVFRVTGGTVDAWGLTLGLAAVEEYPGIAEISGGNVSFVRIENGRVSGLEMAVKKDSFFGLSGTTGAGIFRMSGGMLNTSQFAIGKLVNMAGSDTSLNVEDGYASVSLSGGTMNIGALGFGPSAVWNVTTNASVSPTAWYDVRFSGGTFGALASFTNRARVRLGDADGGVTVRCADLSGAACDIVMAEPLMGPGGLTKTGGGGLYLNAVCTYTGRTEVTEGTLYLNSQSEESASPAALPAATATWVADSLGLAAGASVTAWQATNTTHRFTLAVAQAIRATSTAPHVAAETMNGHAAVAFDGVANALALTGLNPTPVTGATNFTAALVMRSDAAGLNSVSSNFQNNAVLIGQNDGNLDKNRWGIGYSANGRLGGGLVTNTGTSASCAWASPRYLGDGDPHVVLLTWTAGGTVTVSVDGYAQSVSDLSGVASIIQTRMMLATSEWNRPFQGEIAEFRFYSNAALTETQRRALGQELARTYGAETAGYLTDEKKACASLASREIQIVAGAGFHTGGGGFSVANGQLVLGAGTVGGTLRICDGGAIASTNASAALTVADLVLQPGGIIRWRYDSTGAAAPILAGDVTLPNGTVTVEIVSDLETPKPFGALLMYTGTLFDNGAMWNVVGGHSATRVEIDAVNKTVRLTTKTGTLIQLF